MIQNYVTLREEDHRYFDTDGGEYTSLTRVISCFKQKFDSKRISGFVAKKRGVSQDEVLKEWDKMRDDAAAHGSRIHDALERYEKTFNILPDDEDLEVMIKTVAAEYSDYARIFQEEVLYDKGFMIAGMTDKVLQRTTHARSIVDLGDYKTNVRRGIEFSSKYRNYMTGPLSHLEDCNYNHYCLQLSAYAYMLHNLTGQQIGNLHLMFIPHDNPLAFKRIPVPYMKLEVIAMFEAFRALSEPITASEEVEEKQVMPNFT